MHRLSVNDMVLPCIMYYWYVPRRLSYYRIWCVFISCAQIIIVSLCPDYDDIAGMHVVYTPKPRVTGDED